MELKGTKTEKNLWTAFAGESQARNKYTSYASKARKDGYVQIAKIFEETAANEKEHAELWFKALHGDAIPVSYTHLVGCLCHCCRKLCKAPKVVDATRVFGIK